MSTICVICESSHRHQIELDLLSGESLESIFNRYKSVVSGLTIDQLKIHAVCHIKMPDQSSSGESIATKLAFKEVQALTTSCNEYMATLQRIGGVIDKQLTGVENGDCTIQQAISKSLVDLYIGTGTQIRETVKLLTEAYADMNAKDSEYSNRSGLRMLSNALDRSREQYRVG